MDSTFEIVLNYGMETFSIKPPSSYNSLVEIAKEKYDLTIVNRLVYSNLMGEEVRISNDSDYLKFFDFMCDNALQEVDVIIKSDESKSKRKKSIRKWSNLKPPVVGMQDGSHGCINGKIIFFIYTALDEHDFENDMDTRNQKFLMEEGRWSNQSYNQNELRRIYYIKQKKELQREEQMRREGHGIEEVEDEEDDDAGKNSKKRKLKNPKEKNKNNEEEDVKLSKGGKKNKKK